MSLLVLHDYDGYTIAVEAHQEAPTGSWRACWKVWEIDILKCNVVEVEAADMRWIAEAIAFEKAHRFIDRLNDNVAPPPT